MKFLVFIIVIGIICFRLEAYASREKAVQGPVIGFSGFEYKYLDIGYCFGHRINWPSSENLQGYGGLVIGAEVSSLDRIIIAPKLSYSINMFVSFGVSMLYYTDFHTATLQFRPEFGASLYGARIVFGRNFSVGNYPFSGVNKNNYALTLFIPFGTKNSAE